MFKLRVQRFGGIPMIYRSETNDLSIMKEVIETKVYYRLRAGFEVLPGEVWLDLGAHIGSFACYCQLRGATAVCYEPNVSNYKLLRRNFPNLEIYNQAVTAYRDQWLPSWVYFKEKNQSRLTTIPQILNKRAIEGPRVPNCYVGKLMSRKFDGVKMDIEGAEGLIIDSGLIPHCHKMVLEYHTSRLPDLDLMRNRIDVLKSMFDTVQYRPSLERLLQTGGIISNRMGNLDRPIFCVGRV